MKLFNYIMSFVIALIGYGYFNSTEDLGLTALFFGIATVIAGGTWFFFDREVLA